MIEGLLPIIPEARKSNYKVLASHVMTEDLDDFLNDLKEDLNGFMEEREREIFHRLGAKLDAFSNELMELSKQLRMVIKYIYKMSV